jgi:hypothetical protein
VESLQSHCIHTKSSTGPVVHPFAFCHEGPGFNPQGGYLCETGILLLGLSRYNPKNEILELRFVTGTGANIRHTRQRKGIYYKNVMLMYSLLFLPKVCSTVHIYQT